MLRSVLQCEQRAKAATRHVAQLFRVHNLQNGLRGRTGRILSTVLVRSGLC